MIQNRELLFPVESDSNASELVGSYQEHDSRGPRLLAQEPLGKWNSGTFFKLLNFKIWEKWTKKVVHQFFSTEFP